MREPRIGRVLVASLHEAIAEVLPTRLDFYESWLSSAGLRQGSIGLPALAAVLSFLRRENGDYNTIVARAGEYTATWTVATLPRLRRVGVKVLPHALRIRFALGMVRRMVRATYGGSRAVVHLRRSVARVDIRGSLFCGSVREQQGAPLCAFYAAATAHLLNQLGIAAEATLTACRAAGGRGCLLEVRFGAKGSVPVITPRGPGDRTREARDRELE